MTDTNMLRHTVATLAYRGGKAMRGAPAEFATFRDAESSPNARRDSGSHGRSLRLGHRAGRWQTRLAHFPAPRMGRRHGAILCRAGSLRPASCFGPAARHDAGETVPGTDRRRAHAYRSNRHAAPPRWLPVPQRELLRRQYRNGPRQAPIKRRRSGSSISRWRSGSPKPMCARCLSCRS